MTVEVKKPQTQRPSPPLLPPPREGGSNGNSHGQEENLHKDLKRPSTFAVIVAVAVFVLLLAGLFILGWIPHQRQAAQARADAAQRVSSSPIVETHKPMASNGQAKWVGPCDVRANQTTDLYPRANGYLKKLYVDIQDQVQKDQLLAEIDAPEVDAQLAQSKANLEQSKANVVKAQSDLDLAGKTLDRYAESQRLSPGSVTAEQMDQNESAVENARSELAQAIASVAASQANVQQLSVTQGFEKVYAPFSGIITARNYDVGALLNPTATGTGKQLFSIAQTDPLRVFVNLPSPYFAQIKIGQAAYLTVREYPGREFKGQIARTAGALDPNTRTLLVEIHFPNKDNNLFVGMYGQVRLEMQAVDSTLTIPAGALLYSDKGTQVALVRDNKIHIQDIRIARDLGTELQIGGLSADDQVVVNPSDQLAEGMTVQIAKPPAAGNGPTTKP